MQLPVVNGIKNIQGGGGSICINSITIKKALRFVSVFYMGLKSE